MTDRTDSEGVESTIEDLLQEQVSTQWDQAIAQRVEAAVAPLRDRLDALETRLRQTENTLRDRIRDLERP